MNELVVDLSRLQFAVTAMYHFLFVPLTIGLAMLIAIMESVYVMTGKTIWREMTKFWGLLFGINFAMGVATGITMEFQFGTNWAYYSHYVGDVFGVPLALEGMMAFFLESTFVGLFFFGWKRLSRLQHLMVTWLMALGTNLSALWILIANGWMQNPVGAYFNPDTMRMELASMWEVFFNPVGQAKFVHTVAASYVTGAVFMLSVSAYYLLKKSNMEVAKRSVVVAAAFGLASALSVVTLGDESGYLATEHQKMKLAAMEGMWETEEPPAAFTVFGIPDTQEQTTHWKIEVPYALGLIATRSWNKEIPGIKELVETAEERVRTGLIAYRAMLELRADPTDNAARKVLTEHADSLGYALLLRRWTDNPLTAGDSLIRKAALSTIPNVPVLFWSFRLMVAIGLFMIILFAWAFYLSSVRRTDQNRLFLKVAFYSLPLPWIASQLGWIVAEYGRQPWVIEGILPTFLGVSSTNAWQVGLSFAGFVFFYTILLVTDIFLLVKYIRLGPVNLYPPQPSAAKAKHIQRP